MSFDPYVYEGTDILVNHYGIMDEAKLDSVERSLSGFRLWQMLQDEPPPRFDFDHLKRVHDGLFGELYPFAGRIRTVDIRKSEKVLSGRSVDYAAPSDIVREATKAIDGMEASVTMPGETVSWRRLAAAVARLWKSHPFREGNTRAVLLFAHQFARANGFPLDAEAMSRSPQEVRDALAFAATGVEAPLACILAEASLSEDRRLHPVLGRVSAEAAELLESMATVPVRMAARHDAVRGQVACRSYGIVLVQTSKGIVGVDEDDFEVAPEPGSRVDFEIGAPDSGVERRLNERGTDSSSPGMAP